MDYLLALLEVFTAGLAFVLGVIALFAAKRYSERRFAFVGLGLGALGVVSLIGLIDIIVVGFILGGGLG
jgi:1,4-dihydroxy-2-naphthoate octaprenyltransferase